MQPHKTTIGAGAFIGTNSSLVAPAKFGAGAYIGSGSVITMRWRWSAASKPSAKTARRATAS